MLQCEKTESEAGSDGSDLGDNSLVGISGRV